MLSRETLEGLYITGKFITSVYMHVSIIHLFAVKSFIELTKYLLSTAGDNVMFLSERVSQDPLENYFGQLRARGGGRNENPTVQQCVHHANAIECKIPGSKPYVHVMPCLSRAFIARRHALFHCY